MILLTVILTLVILGVAAFFLLPVCSHTCTDLETVNETIIKDWYEHEFTVPQLPTEKIRCYRQDFRRTSKCKECGLHIHSVGYNQKPHESDTMHKNPPGWQPEPAPWQNENSNYNN